MDTKNPLSLSGHSGPKYMRLLTALENGIRAGTLPPGYKLPPVRELAWSIGVTPGTVARAYRLATEEGLLEATVGRGTFVRGAARTVPEVPVNFVARAPAEGHLNLRNGHTVELGQTEVIGAAISAVIAGGGLALSGYVRDQALHGCRDHASAWLRGIGVAGETGDLVLTYGAHNSVMVALNAVLHGRDPAILTTELTYPGFRQLAHIARARMVGVASDDEGLRPDRLEDACRQHRPQALIISSNVHNPTCVVTSATRRREIARIARAHDVQIIEDDVYGTLIDDRPDGFDVLCPERTWHATSLSKCFAAGLRVGFLQCPPGLGSLGIRVMQGLSLSISQVLTQAVERLFADGAITEFSRRVRAENIARLEMAREVLAGWDVSSRPGVNYVWVKKPEGWTGSAFLQACERERILIAAGDSFTLPGGAAPNAMRLTLSGTEDSDTLREGLERIARLLAEPPVAGFA